MSEEVSQVPSLIDRGLTEDEAKLLTAWVAEGKPGLITQKAESMGEIYVLGYSCQELHKWFPEFSVEALLWARLEYGWDELRSEYRRIVHDQTLQAAITTRMSSIRFLTDYISATHRMWQGQIMAYLKDPEHTQPPDFLPKNVYTYSQVLSMLENMVKPPKEKGSKDSSNPFEGMPLVSINIGDGKKPDISIAPMAQKNVRDALIEDMKKKKGKP